MFILVLVVIIVAVQTPLFSENMKLFLRAVTPLLVSTSCLLFIYFISRISFSMSNSSRQDYTNVVNTKISKLLSVQKSYLEALRTQANSKGEIILVSTDYGYIQMALNLYLTSLQKLNLTNYLFITSDNDAAAVLEQNGIAHFKIAEDKEGKKASNYGSTAFKRKTHIKTKIVHEALVSGFTVLFTDVDIVFLQDPFPYLKYSTYDIQMQSDTKAGGNSGFYLAMPSRAAISLHRVALETAARRPELSNQNVLNRVIRQMVKQDTLKIKMLSVDQFPNGNTYFQHGHRMFFGENPCKDCVTIHNNFIVSGAAKIYRFKEHLLWMVDTNSYYSNPNAKYLMFENPIDFGNATRGAEKEALKSALIISHMLGRILILPSFHCYNCKDQSCKLPPGSISFRPHCSLNTHFRITTFDASFAYREHVFLLHPLVPKKVLQSQSATILLKTATVMKQIDPKDLKSIPHQFTPANSTTGPTAEEILQWLEPMSMLSILRFHSLYGAVGILSPQDQDKEFHTSLNKGLSDAEYMQW